MASVQRLKKLKVTKLSLLDQPSSVGVIALYKREASDGMVKQASLCKFAKKKGHLYLVSMLPNRVDSHGQWATPETCAEACHTWQEEGCQLDFNHGRKKYDGRDLANAEAVAIENGIIQKGDLRFAGMVDKHGEEIDPTDGWGTVVKLKSKKLLKLAEAGKLNTSSLESLPGDFELVDEELPNPLEKSAMNDDEKKEMDSLKARLAKLEKPEETGDVAGLVKALPGMFKDALAEAFPKKKESKEGDGAGDDDGEQPDMSDPKVAREHTRKLEKAELLKKADTKSAKGSAAYQEKLQKMADRHQEEDDKLSEETGSLRKAEADGYSRSESADRKQGSSMADRINRRNGHRSNPLDMPTNGGK